MNVIARPAEGYAPVSPRRGLSLKNFTIISKPQHSGARSKRLCKNESQHTDLLFELQPLRFVRCKIT